MRKNLFLHFMNCDTREIFDVYRFHTNEDHTKLLRRSLNAAVLLCEDYCIMPPGFVIEDEIAFGLVEADRELLETRVLQFPMRETSLSDYAEKKRIEYFPLRDRYSGLFNDNRLDFIGRHAQGIIRRKSNIGDQIVRGWREGAETNVRV